MEHKHFSTTKHTQRMAELCGQHINMSEAAGSTSFANVKVHWIKYAWLVVFMVEYKSQTMRF